MRVPHVPAGIKKGLQRQRRSFRPATLATFGFLLIPGSLGCNSAAEEPPRQTGFVSIFDGETLEGWEGDSTYWRVESGRIIGEVTPATLLDHNSWLIWRGGEVRDFELMVEYRVSARGNSGIGYRTEEIEDVPYALRGYQADLDGENRYTGMNYEERRRTTLASQGERVIVPPIDNAGGLEAHIEANEWVPAIVDGSLGDPDSLDAHVNDLDWNQYHLSVRGNRMRHYVNGVLMSDVTDNDTTNRSFEGLLGVQVHVGPPMTVEYRNFKLKVLE